VATLRGGSSTCKFIPLAFDLGKTTSHLVALGASGQVLIRKKFSQKQPLAFTANMASLDRAGSLLGGAFSWTRVESTGPRCSIDCRSVREALLKSNKNDYLDAGSDCRNR
jgi:transposase